MRKYAMHFIFLLILSGWMAPCVMAKELAGVDLPDSVVVDDQTLILNGASVRKKFVFDIYVVGLYLAKANQSAKSIMSGKDKKPKRLMIVFLQDVNVEMFFKAIRENVNNNFSQKEKMAYFNEFTDFFSAFVGKADAKKGEVIYLDYIPKVGLKMTYDNKVVAVIKNEKFLITATTKFKRRAAW